MLCTVSVVDDGCMDPGPVPPSRLQPCSGSLDSVTRFRVTRISRIGHPKGLRLRGTQHQHRCFRRCCSLSCNLGSPCGPKAALTWSECLVPGSYNCVLCSEGLTCPLKSTLAAWQKAFFFEVNLTLCGFTPIQGEHLLLLPAFVR